MSQQIMQDKPTSLTMMWIALGQCTYKADKTSESLINLRSQKREMMKFPK